MHPTQRYGLVALVLALVFARFLHPATPAARMYGDGITGLLFGVAIGLLLLSVLWKSREKKFCSRAAAPR